MKLTETLKRRIDTFFRNLTDKEIEYLIEKYFNKHEKAINYNVVVPKGTLCDDCKKVKTDTVTLCIKCYLNT